LGGFGKQVDLVVDALPLDFEDKLLLVVLAPEVEVVLESLVCGRCEHDVYSLLLAWLESAAGRLDLEFGPVLRVFGG
jgi:hypothetical protein